MTAAIPEASAGPPSPWLGASTTHYENFPVGSLLLPAAVRPAIATVYRFARYGDDVADEGDASDAQRLRELERLRRALTEGAAHAHPIVTPLLPVIQAYRLERDWFTDLLSAFEQDVRVKRYPRRADLLDYCRRSANPVGRIVLQLCGCLDERSGALSDRICTALQLVNFCQDLAIDCARGRLYLPLDEVAAQGLSEAQIDACCAAHHASEPLRSLVARQADFAQGLLDEGRPLFARVPLRLSLELRAIVAGATRVLQLLRKGRYDPLAQRPRLRKRDALPVLAGMFR